MQMMMVADELCRVALLSLLVFSLHQHSDAQVTTSMNKSMIPPWLKGRECCESNICHQEAIPCEADEYLHTCDVNATMNTSVLEVLSALREQLEISLRTSATANNFSCFIRWTDKNQEKIIFMIENLQPFTENCSFLIHDTKITVLDGIQCRCSGIRYCSAPELMSTHLAPLSSFGLNPTPTSVLDDGVTRNAVQTTASVAFSSANWLTPKPSSQGSEGTSFPLTTEELVIVVFVAVVALAVCVAACLLIIVCYYKRRTNKITKTAYGESAAFNHLTLATSSLSSSPNGRIFPNPLYGHTECPIVEEREAEWSPIFSRVTVTSSQLTFSNVLGQGAFGMVYKGTLLKDSVEHSVAVKTLKECSSREDLQALVSESALMLDFHHPNVMSLLGVCFDTEDHLPLIILPFMANGDLKSFLVGKRKESLTSSLSALPEELTQKQLIDMCLDIAKGMCYLAGKKFVHRDLAARNCMLDEDLKVKVADFGLSRDIYTSDYHCLSKKARLPVKWMSVESLFDNKYNEKSDVWSFGVTCWEIFSLGCTPYPGVDNADIPQHISDGGRLNKPHLCMFQLYYLMQSCWYESPSDRPTFKSLVTSLQKISGDGATMAVDYAVLERSDEEDEDEEDEDEEDEDGG